VTQEGYVGTCPRWVEEGDKVILISGFRTLFIVRESGEEYQTIGPAYVEGFMDGEKWDQEKVRDIALVQCCSRGLCVWRLLRGSVESEDTLLTLCVYFS
jgi:hypothetical protein